MANNAVARDFDDRETVERARLHVTKLKDFAANVEAGVRSHTALLQQRLDALERRVDHLDAAVERHVSPAAAPSTSPAAGPTFP